MVGWVSELIAHFATDSIDSAVARCRSHGVPNPNLLDRSQRGKGKTDCCESSEHNGRGVIEEKTE